MGCVLQEYRVFATSALTAEKQDLYCMGRPDLCGSGEPLQSRSIQLCARRISDAGDPIKPLQRDDVFSVRRSMPSAKRHSNSVPREVDDSAIQVTSFATALSLSSLDRLRASRLLLPRSGLERSDFVHWPPSRSWAMSALPPLSGDKTSGEQAINDANDPYATARTTIRAIQAGRSGKRVRAIWAANSLNSRSGLGMWRLPRCTRERSRARKRQFGMTSTRRPLRMSSG